MCPCLRKNVKSACLINYRDKVSCPVKQIYVINNLAVREFSAFINILRMRWHEKKRLAQSSCLEQTIFLKKNTKFKIIIALVYVTSVKIKSESFLYALVISLLRGVTD